MHGPLAAILVQRVGIANGAASLSATQSISIGSERKMPRPKPDELRDKHISIPVTEKEREALHRKASKEGDNIARIGRVLLFKWLKEKA